jgi:hypothetical protein
MGLKLIAMGLKPVAIFWAQIIAIPLPFPELGL